MTCCSRGWTKRVRVKDVPTAPEFTYPEEAITTTKALLNVSGEAQALTTLRLYVDGALETTQELEYVVWWSVSLSLSEGRHIITATSTDSLGQVSPPGTAGTVVVDTVPPVVNVGDLPLYSSEVITVEWSGSDEGAGVASYDVQVRIAGGEWQAWLNQVSGTWAVYNGTDGHSYAFRVRARDEAGNVSAYSAAPYPETTVDITEPAATLHEIAESSPYAQVDGDTVYYGPGSGSFQVRLSASDATSGLDRAEYPATVSAGGVYTEALGGGYQYAHGYSFTASSTEEGGYQARVYDLAGHFSTVSFTVTRDVASPAVSLTVPARSGVVTVPVRWGGDDGSGSGVGGYDLEVSEDGGGWTRLLTDTHVTSYEYVGQYGHVYGFRVRARDNVSNPPGEWVEASVSVVQVTKYYAFNGQRVAMREGDVVYYLHGDHLGSTSVASSDSGALHSRQGYTPYGEVRYVTGELPTEFGFTGQRNDSYIKLIQMGARWYDAQIGRFVSADTIIPNFANPQSLNRYAYVENRPLVAIDPTGHDLMIVGGYNNNNWNDPIEWKGWIRAYKG